MHETAHGTTCAPDAAVQFDYVARAGELMQSVDILRDDRQFRKAILPPRDHFVRRIWFQRSEHVPPIIKPFPNSGQVSLKHHAGRDDVDRESLPNGRVTTAPKRRHARFSRHTRTRQHQHALRLGETPAQFGGNLRRIRWLHERRDGSRAEVYPQKGATNANAVYFALLS